MGSASVHFAVPRNLWHRLSPGSGQPHCAHTGTLWHRLRFRTPGVLLSGTRYCIDSCLEQALSDALRRTYSLQQRAAASHRVPLGLLMMSRQQITPEQLQLALETQRAKGYGRIGEWLETLGFVSETQVTAALARQWSCPVLRSNSIFARRGPQLPVTLLARFEMIPVDYVEVTSTLHLAFADGLDYSILYAIEQMIGCHTEPCMAAPSFVHSHLHALTAHRTDSEVVFERLSDMAEVCRIIRSYCLRVAASEIRLIYCAPYFWIRLERFSLSPLDLLLHAPRQPDPSGIQH